MTWFFFGAAFIILMVLGGSFLPDNSPEKRMERLFDMVPGFHPDFRHDDIWNARVLAFDAASRQFVIGSPGKPVRVFSFDDLVTMEVDGLTLKLVVNDVADPIIELAFYRDGKVKMKHVTPPTVAADKRLAEWYGRFRVILNRQTERQPTPPAEAPSATFGRRRGLIASS